MVTLLESGLFVQNTIGYHSFWSSQAQILAGIFKHFSAIQLSVRTPFGGSHLCGKKKKCPPPGKMVD